MSSTNEEKNDSHVSQTLHIASDGGDNSQSAVVKVEHVTGWRFVAVGVAIVLSMFLVRLPHHKVLLPLYLQAANEQVKASLDLVSSPVQCCDIDRILAQKLT